MVGTKDVPRVQIWVHPPCSQTSQIAEAQKALDSSLCELSLPPRVAACVNEASGMETEKEEMRWEHFALPSNYLGLLGWPIP